MNKITNIITENIMNYSAYIITGRVIPSIEDGLKPIHRRILWTMYENKIFKFNKSKNVTGMVMRYSPHGDCYDAMVNMVQVDNQNLPFIIGKGSFGQHTSRNMAPAADRYTEVKLSDVALYMLDGVKNNMVEFIPNYDDTRQIPKYLPSKFPSILCYATTGIGVGMATNIPSYNIGEVCDATIEYLESNKKVILSPDFATGANIIQDKQAFSNIINTGKGTIKLRAKCEIVKNVIQVTEIPYTTTREDIISKVVTLAKEKKLPEIANIEDLTDKNGLLIDITCKRNTDPELVLQKLFKMTPLESTFSANMNVLYDGKPYLLGFYDIIDKWYEFRQNCIKNSLHYEVQKLQKELHIAYGLRTVLLDIDKTIEIIRYSQHPELDISKHFNIDNIQAEYICNMKLKNINEDHIIKQSKDIEDKEALLKTIQHNIQDENYLKQQVIEGIKQTKHKFNKPRKTQLIEPPSTKVEKTIEQKMIDKYPVTLTLTKDGYFKKFKPNVKGENKLKPGDEILYTIQTCNSGEVVFYGDDLCCYKFNIHELEENKLNTLGVYIPNLIECGCLGMTVIDDYNQFVVMVYKNRVAKVDINSYKTTTNRKKLKNSLYSKELIYAHTLKQDTVLDLKTKKGKTKSIDTNKLNMKLKRDTQGTKILGKDEFIK